MRIELGWCLDCNELEYEIPNKNGAIKGIEMSNNHVGHRQYIFGAPEQYSPPIRNLLTKLHAGAPISNNEIVLFRLAIAFGDLDRFLAPLDAKGNDVLSGGGAHETAHV